MYSYKIVYVLIDGITKQYYKELFISLKSIRQYMTDIAVKVVVDEPTNCFLESESRIINFIRDNAEIVSVSLDSGMSEKEKSRFLKTTLRNIIDGDFLFLDTDTIICDALPLVISNDELSMVLDANCKVSERINPTDIKEQAIAFKLDYFDYDYYFNSGVIWCKDSPYTRLFWNQWHEVWNQTKQISFYDQPSLNYLCRRDKKVTELNPLLNVQVSVGNLFPIELIHNAYIIHYYNCSDSYYYLCDKQQVEDLISEGREEIIINNARGAFSRIYTFSPDNIKNGYYEIMHSDTFHLSAILYNKYPKIFRMKNLLAKSILSTKSFINKVFRK